MTFLCVVFSWETNIQAFYEFEQGYLPTSIFGKYNLIERSLNRSQQVPETPKLDLSKDFLIDKCRALLYSTYIEEMDWDPPMDSKTEFAYAKSNLIPNTMLVDRYDTKNSYWICILDMRTLEVVACCRLLVKDHDIFNYSSCPIEVYKMLGNPSKLTPAAEAQRTAISYKYRKSSLFMYLHYFSCIFADEKLNYTTVFTTLSYDYLISFSKSIGLVTEPGWQFKYNITDPESTILYVNPKVAVSNIRKRMPSKL